MERAMAERSEQQHAYTELDKEEVVVAVIVDEYHDLIGCMSTERRPFRGSDATHPNTRGGREKSSRSG